jgi:dihydroorotase
VRDYDEFIPVFVEMEKHDMVLNLHGEVPGSPGSDITDMNAEEKFLPTLKMLNERFPKLRIILEHCSTEAALEAVRSCSSSVAGMFSLVALFIPGC